MKEKIIKVFPFIYISLLVLLILGPLLKTGYIFFLDFVMYPKFNISFRDYFLGGGLINSAPWHFFIYFLSKIIPTYIIQKIILISIFLFSGLAVWYIIPKKLGIVPRLLAATFYIINPFVYERLAAGHIGVLLGYMLFPFVLYATFNVFKKKTWRSIIFLGLLWTLQIVFAAHFLVITGVCVGVIFIAYAIKYFFEIKKENWKKILFNSPLRILFQIVLLVTILNSFWWLPIVLRDNSNIVSQINSSHFTAYQSSTDNNYGLVMNLAGMYGFWRERTAPDEFILAKNILPAWPLFFAIFLFPIFFGIRGLIKDKKYIYVGSLIAMGVVSVILSIGPQYGFIGSINKFIFSYVPAFKGLRESQKFISILVLVYTVFIAYGFYYLKTVNKKRVLYYIASFVVFINIFIYNYPLLWAANGQLEARNYPYSYQKANQLFSQDVSEDYKILILPWHMYVIGHSLTPNRTIVDPAPRYFFQHKNKMFYSQDEEMDYVKNTSPTIAVIKSLQHSGSIDQWKDFLQSAKVKYLFINKVKDTKAHGFDFSIFKSELSFSVIVEDDNAILFLFNSEK